METTRGAQRSLASIELKRAISFQFRAIVTPKLGAVSRQVDLVLTDSRSLPTMVTLGSSGTSQNLESANTPPDRRSQLALASLQNFAFKSPPPQARLIFGRRQTIQNPDEGTQWKCIQHQRGVLRGRDPRRKITQQED